MVFSALQPSPNWLLWMLNSILMFLFPKFAEKYLSSQKYYLWILSQSRKVINTTSEAGSENVTRILGDRCYRAFFDLSFRSLRSCYGPHFDLSFRSLRSLKIRSPSNRLQLNILNNNLYSHVSHVNMVCLAFLLCQCCRSSAILQRSRKTFGRFSSKPLFVFEKSQKLYFDQK